MLPRRTLMGLSILRSDSGFSPEIQASLQRVVRRHQGYTQRQLMHDPADGGAAVGEETRKDSKTPSVSPAKFNISKQPPGWRNWQTHGT